uniref:Uma2 family endonuclease n=1 Tax=Schlesneria paludicola TaxID=360056 RepID=A0A7C2P0T6_9PLAN
MGENVTAVSTSQIESRQSRPRPKIPSRRGEPTWELADEFPRQGEWTEEDYLKLDSNRLIEFTDGVLEFLPMPKVSHARISRRLSDLLRGHVESHRLGETFWAPVSVRLKAGKFREPDVFFVREGRLAKDDVCEGADLVMEIVSGDNKDRRRDLKQKRTEYAQAGIPEYWIVDPETETITVLTLPVGKTKYAVHGEFKPGQEATSVLLPGFRVDVTACFAAGKGET